MTFAELLVDRLKSLGIRQVFGIPGDYILPVFEALEASELAHVATCNELNGGYAADGYARLNGAGAIAVTYGPGAFSLVNAVAAAYAERSPLVVISGGPPLAAYRDQRPMHHVLPKRYRASLDIFEAVTAGVRALTDPERAVADMDELLALCLHESRPVYLEVPQDLQTRTVDKAPAWSLPAPPVDRDATDAAIDMLAQRLQASARSVLLVGYEVQAAGCATALRRLVDRTGLPVASVFSGRPRYLEDHPRSIGLYHGMGSLPPIREFVEAADTVIWLGAPATDFDRGGSTAKLTAEQEIHIFDNCVESAGGRFAPVRIADVIDGLLERLPEGQWSGIDTPTRGWGHLAGSGYRADPEARMTNRRFYDRMADFIDASDVVFADAGPCINMAYVELPAGASYIASGYWASIGAGFGMTVGACFAAEAEQRVVAFEGDGAFQMTAQELSTMVRYNRPAIVFVMNNRGYTAERLIHDGEFNDVQNWDYWRLPELYGGVAGCLVRSEGELEAALERAGSHDGPGPLVIEVQLDPMDVSDAFARMSEGLRSR